MPIRVTLHKKAQTRFKQRACRAFPVEIVGFLVGKNVDGMILTVEDIWYPPDWKDHADEWRVEFQPNWYADALTYAQSRGLSLIGTAHTHTYSASHEHEPVLSNADREDWGKHDLVAAVAVVVKHKNGKKTCRDMAFFGPAVNVDLTVV
jgi:proteasome lid subunit RPN8/RPN11